MKTIPLFLLLLFFSADQAYACSRIAPFMLKEYEGMSVVESNLAASDVVFHGYLISAETTARKTGEDDGSRKYRYVVLEKFKGDLEAGQIVEIAQKRTYCSFTYRIDEEHLVYLNKDEKGTYYFGMAHSGPLYDRTIDMENTEDAEFYSELVAAGRGDDYAVRSSFADGKPKLYVYSVEKQLGKIRAAPSLNK